MREFLRKLQLIMFMSLCTELADLKFYSVLIVQSNVKTNWISLYSAHPTLFTASHCCVWCDLFVTQISDPLKKQKIVADENISGTLKWL